MSKEQKQKLGPEEGTKKGSIPDQELENVVGGIASPLDSLSTTAANAQRVETTPYEPQPDPAEGVLREGALRSSPKRS